MIELAQDTAIQEVASAVGAEVPWHLLAPESTWAIHREGQPVAIFGCPQLWPGFGQVWGFVNFELAQGHGLWLTREARRALDRVVERFAYRQVRAVCFSAEHIRWTELIGFQLEGVWQEAGPLSQDVFIMVFHRRH